MVPVGVPQYALAVACELLHAAVHETVALFAARARSFGSTLAALLVPSSDPL